MFTREIVFTPAFDKRSEDPTKNYGIHGAEMRWYLKGPQGVIQFIVYTNWHLPHVQEELDSRVCAGERFPHRCCHPLPTDIGYHSPLPTDEGQTLQTDQCPVLDGPCYYDGSSLQAEEIYKVLVSEGSEAVWEKMEARYYGLWPQEGTIPCSP